MEDSLLEKLGGESGVGKIVEEFYKRALEDPRIRNRYNNVALDELKTKETAALISLIKNETPYVQGSLIPAHTGLGITKHELNLVVTLYEDAAKELGATSHAAQQFTDLITSVRADIEGH